MKIIKGSNKEELFAEVLNRSQFELDNVNKAVKTIIEEVEAKGDKALIEFTEKFDGVLIDKLEVTKEEIDEAYNSIDKELLESLIVCHNNIRDFHQKQKHNSFMTNEKNGVIVGQLINPIEKVGIYVPGGTAPLPSTVLMNAVPAKVAGVSDIIMTTPPGKDGKINKTILAAAKIAGVDRIFKVGGAQAVAGLAKGTESIPKVYKIVGPGNIYVAMAKKMVFGEVDIDMIAGPSEVLVIADKDSNPRYIAADLLSQAEHDTLACSILVTDSMELAEAVSKEVDIQIEKLSRSDIAKTSMKSYGRIVLTETIDEAIDIANQVAPEHLEISVKEPFAHINKIRNAGAIFVGEYSPEPLGDYYAGPNHTLPTSGTAKFASPLNIEDFVKKSSLIYYTREALTEAKDHIIRVAESEGLDAHANSIKVRFE